MEGRDGVEFLVFGGVTAIWCPAFIMLLGKLLRSSTPTFLAVNGPAGHYPARVFLNRVMAQFASDPSAMRALLERLLNAAQSNRFAAQPSSFAKPD
jgi:hypothetical protein